MRERKGREENKQSTIRRNFKETRKRLRQKTERNGKWIKFEREKVDTENQERKTRGRKGEKQGESTKKRGWRESRKTKVETIQRQIG